MFLRLPLTFTAVMFCCCLQQPSAQPTRSAITFDAYTPFPFAELSQIRDSLTKAGISADSYLFENFSRQIDTLQLNLQEAERISKYMKTAETYLSARYFLPSDASILFDAMGDKMLTKLTDTLEYVVNQKGMNGADETVQYIAKRLGDNRYLVNFRVSNTAKLWQYLKEGRIEYIFHKLTTTYLREFAIFLGLCLLLLIGLFQAWKRLKRSKTPA